MIIVTLIFEKLRFHNNSSGFKSVFEKVRFRGRLVWTVDLIEQIELRFQIPLLSKSSVFVASVT